MPKARPSRLPRSRLPFRPRARRPTLRPLPRAVATLSHFRASKSRRNWAPVPPPWAAAERIQSFRAVLVTRLQGLVDSLGPPRPSAQGRPPICVPLAPPCAMPPAQSALQAKEVDCPGLLPPGTASGNRKTKRDHYLVTTGCLAQ